MTATEIRRRFLDFFAKREHTILPSASLVPENDPTVLFNTAGMQPLAPYLLGQPHPQGNKLANFQKCLRTTDIEDIGDATHATFFEMMGNWSLGAYFKEEAISWSWELLTSKEEGFGLDPSRLYVTVFQGLMGPDGSLVVPPDEEAKKIWMSVGLPEHRIYMKGAEANWWPAVKGEDTWTGPTGPCSEMFYDITPHGLGDLTPAEYEAADSAQQVVEIWNDVFMEYEKKDGRIIGRLSQKNVDTGSGFERVCMVLQGKDNIFDTDIFSAIVAVIDTATTKPDARARRIVADHLRAATMLVADGVIPSNTDQGYVVRRLIRRAVRFADSLGMPADALATVVRAVISTYAEAYPNVESEAELIESTIIGEEAKFRLTLTKGLKKFEEAASAADGKLDSQTIFDLYQSFGFPVELTEEIARERKITIDRAGFQILLDAHRADSRAGAEQKFKGGLADSGEMSVKYHTATHLLHQALRDVLGDHISQKGSNITSERLRFDFAHPAKMTEEEKARVEEIINHKIEASLPIQMVTLPKDEAEKTGALHFFGEKYGDEVNVYYIGEDLSSAYSKEFCGGPHMKNTGGLGRFKITKEEAVAQGIRRIKAILE